MGYPSVMGRLHTRYAPVRNSSAPEGLLPFYLHVLSLPLAFILSQDQTLHCKKFNLIYDSHFNGVSCFSYLSLLIYICQWTNLICSKTISNYRFSGCKCTTFFIPYKPFLKNFSVFIQRTISLYQVWLNGWRKYKLFN